MVHSLQLREQHSLKEFEFQEFAGIRVTGQMNEETLARMLAPRCGLPDVIRPGDRIPPNARETNRNKPSNFYAPGFKWDKNEVTYKFVGFSRQLPQSSQRRAIRNAFSKWSAVTPLQFRESSGAADILINWVFGDHGDGSPFDRRGGTLAHAFFPGTSAISGDTHFDEAEEWTEGKNAGTNLEIVAAHEFGHAIGLSHSNVRGALMQPFYGGYDPNYQLQSDDIRGVQTLYGSAPRPQPRPQPTRAPPATTPRDRDSGNNPDKEICELKFDDIANGPDNRLYAFRFGRLYKFNYDGVGIEKVYKNSRRVFPKAPKNIAAAAFDRRNNKFYIFKVTSGITTTTEKWITGSQRLDPGLVAADLSRNSEKGIRLSAILGSIPGITQLRASRNDDRIDRLNHVYTTVLLVVFAVVVSTTQFAGHPIHCWHPPEFEEMEWYESYIDNYCWISNTYHVPFSEELFPTNQPWKQSPRFPLVTFCDFHIRQQQNIQRWTLQCVLPINLFNEKVFIFLWFWLFLMVILSIYNLVSWCYIVMLKRHRYQYVKKYLKVTNRIQGDFDDKLCRRFANHYFRDDGVFVLRIISNNATDLVTTELVNYLWQMFQDKQSCGRPSRAGEKLRPLPRDANTSATERFQTYQPWKQSPRFPLVTFCDFEIRQLQNIQRWTLQCVLPINLFNEKVFIFLWFLLFLMVILSIYNLVSWCYIVMLKRHRYQYVKKYLTITNRIQGDFDDKL
ncbi:MMP12-like protein [Mya arenaria]|uniref:Innexin n=1 Tax=Mya arenaria TaxID=6604 RepID=A0ABY7E0U2_MYAAR|nr:MMP12-like protein [Mya arenaria]